MCDLERNCVLDLLPDRNADSVASWLKRWTGIKVVACGRAGLYADGVRCGAPLATGHTDMRKGFASLSLQVQEVLRRDPLSGHLFCFRGRRGDLLKVIWHDGQGACLFTKKLGGRFIWPSLADGVVSISQAQMSYLLSGIDWRNPQESWRPTSVGQEFVVEFGDECDSIWLWNLPPTDCHPISPPHMQ
ncbi:IS66 family insertion sequence element accessory protein TnpB [Bradyrhizobium sp. 166]|nr:IS66 family insertion sequence element accessory protein TnpB [Bradyrhizobium sp. 166]